MLSCWTGTTLLTSEQNLQQWTLTMTRRNSLTLIPQNSTPIEKVSITHSHSHTDTYTKVAIETVRYTVSDRVFFQFLWNLNSFVQGITLNNKKVWSKLPMATYKCNTFMGTNATGFPEEYFTVERTWWVVCSAAEWYKHLNSIWYLAGNQNVYQETGLWKI